MSTPGRRAERLASQIREEIAELITRGLKDPRIGFATVTRVELSADLRHARVGVSVIGSGEAQEASLEGLSSAAGYIRHEIGHRMRVRYAPELTFVLDHGAEESQKIEMLLQKLKEEQ
jgi:ribosome-binding factor A